MGVLTGKDIFSSKWVTAEITTAAGRIYYVPIKNELDEYFIAKIEGRLYVFNLDRRQIKVYYHTLVKSFRVLQYDLTNYEPLGPEINELELIMKKNNLPKIDRTLFEIIKYLGKRERGKFNGHNLEEIIEDLSTLPEEYKIQSRNMVQYLQNLNIDKVVTPLKNVSEYLDSTVIATKPRFLGEILEQAKTAVDSDRMITNAPITGKKSWVMIIAIFMIVGLVGGLVYMAYTEGYFDNLFGIQLPDFGSFAPSVGGGSSSDIMKQYPDPIDLKIAIDQGKVNYNSLPSDIKQLVDSVELPKATPILPAPNPLSEGN